MQLNEFIDRVYERAGVDRNDPMVTNEAVTMAVNDGLRHYQLEIDWPWLQASETITTIAGTDSYTPASDWRRTRSLSAPNGNVLTRYDLHQLIERWTGNESGIPREFAIDLEKIVLRPNPSEGLALTHRYVRREKSLAQSDDTPYLPDECSLLVVEYATSVVLRKVRRFSDANICVASYQAELSIMRDERRRSYGPYRPRIRPGEFF